MHNIFDSQNFLFILASPGAGGHRLGRIISCINNVYWYTHTKNGEKPWDVFFNNSVSGKSISQYHYDRLVGEMGSVPLVGERIERWWNIEDHNNFYNNVWAKEIIKFQKILEDQYIHWVLHDVPENLLTRFPNSKIISLIDNDVRAVANRHIATTSKFPCYYHHSNLKPSYLNEHASMATALHNIKPDATERDLWIFKNYKVSANYEKDYEESVYNKILTDNAVRNSFEDPRHKKITWESLDLSQVIDFLKADTIDSNYKFLIV